MDDLKILKNLCKKTMDKLTECDDNLRAAGTMSVQDIDVLDKLTHMAKSLKTTIAMMEAEENGESRRSYDGGMSGRRSYADGGSYADESYDGGMSNRRGRSPSTGRYVSRDGGYSGHDGLEDILEDVRDMPDSERRKLKLMLERM